MSEQNLFGSELHILNVGTPLFQKEIARQQVPCLHADWKPAAGGDPVLIDALDRLLEDPEVDEANRIAAEKIKNAHPVLVDIDQAIRVIPGMTPKTILHAGPPIAYKDMCGPMRGAIMGALMYEGLAATAEEADALAASGEITFSPCHEHHAVGPMAGIISPSMPVHVVKNITDGNCSYATVNEGLGKVLRFGANSPEVLDRLRYIQNEFMPVLKQVIALAGGVDLKNLTAQALNMGDECHNRNKAATALLIRDLLPYFLDDSIDLVGTRANGSSTGVGDNHTSRAYYLGGADDCAKVALVGHVVEHDHKGVSLARCGNDVLDSRVREGLGPRDDALVGTVTREAIKAGAGHGLALHAGIGKPAYQHVKRLVGPLGRAGAILHVGGANGNAGVKRLRDGAAPLDEVGAQRRGALLVLAVTRTLRARARALGSALAAAPLTLTASVAARARTCALVSPAVLPASTRLRRALPLA